jgi:aconitate hydratase
VVAVIVELFGEGVSALSVGDRATISNMSPEFGSTASLFPIDANTIEYLKLTGRSAEQRELVEAYAKAQGLWSDTLSGARYDRPSQSISAR